MEQCLKLLEEHIRKMYTTLKGTSSSQTQLHVRKNHLKWNIEFAENMINSEFDPKCIVTKFDKDIMKFNLEKAKLRQKIFLEIFAEDLI